VAQQRFVIVGGGLAGAKAAEALRDKGYDGRLTLVGDERHLPYERPPLSKDHLAGKADRDSMTVHPAAWYDEHGVELALGIGVSRIDRDDHRVQLADGSSQPYDKLLLATGASPRRPRIPGADAPGVHYLRRIEDSEAIRDAFGTARRIVVVGGGWIGLEVASAARQAGVAVTLLEAAELPLLRVLGPEVAPVFAELHRQHDVDLRFDANVAEIAATGVKLADGTKIAADAVVVGVGAAPNTQLAERAGLHVDNGIVVDAALRTTDPDIVAAGDVANAFHPVLGRHIRVEHWANALSQPPVAAATMLGETASHDDLPYFFTDQYDLGMEFVGDTSGYDRVVCRGAGREFIAFWLKDNRLLAGMNVNVWDVVDPIKAMIGRIVDPEALADPAKPLTAAE
jgi:3-phenylpropionate/trans-cinnamate dioxygenase ferredoxin reductase subunit